MAPAALRVRGPRGLETCRQRSRGVPLMQRAREEPRPIEDAARRRRMGVLLLVVFVDLLGFGVLIPLIPFYAERLGLAPTWITLVIALHSLAQFLAAPAMGRLSDRYGRRPVLALSMAGHALAYGLLLIADSVPLLVLSRLLSGATSANLATAYAYVSDITPAARRPSGFAQISAAFALGFALGPALGALLVGSQSPTEADLDGPALLAAALSMLALLGIHFLLPESLPASARSKAARAPRMHGLSGARASGGASDAAHVVRERAVRSARYSALRDPLLPLMLGTGLLVLSFAAMRESILSLWLHDRFAFDAHTIGIVFTINGLTVACAQGLAAGRLAQLFGALATLRAGILFYASSWVGLA